MAIVALASAVTAKAQVGGHLLAPKGTARSFAQPVRAAPSYARVAASHYLGRQAGAVRGPW
jgi:hypothetical protein